MSRDTAVIQTNVPICSECGGALKHNQRLHTYICYNCGTRYEVVSEGQTDREMVCSITRPAVK